MPDLFVIDLQIGLQDVVNISALLQITEQCDLAYSMSLGGQNTVSVELAERITADIEITAPLGFGLIGGHELNNRIGDNAGYCAILNELAETKKGLCQVNNTIGDYGYTGGLEMFVQMPENGLSDTMVLRSAIGGADTTMLTQQFTVQISGEDISKYVTAATISLYGSSIIANIELTLAMREDRFRVGQIIDAFVGEEWFTFRLEETEVSGTEYKLWGRALSAALYDPYVTQQTYAEKAGLGDVIAQSITDRVIWEAEPYAVGALSGDMYPAEAIQKIAEAGGMDVRGLDKLYIIDPLAITNYVSLENILEKTITRDTDSYDATRVSLSSDDVLVIESDDTDIEIGQTAEVKVYSSLPYTFRADGVTSLLSQSNIRETVTEDIQLDDGVGTLKYPFIKLVSGEVIISGQKVYAEGYRYITIQYETEYDIYHITSNQAMEALIYIAETENTVVVGAGDRVLNDDGNELITSSDTALLYAQRLLVNNSGRTAKFKVPYNPELAGIEPKAVRYDDFRGIVTSLEIGIESNPIKIYHTLEAREYVS